MLCAGAAFPQSSPSNGVAPPPAATPPSASLPQTSQVADAETTHAIDELAAQAVMKLPKKSVRVLVIDFASINGIRTPLDAWLGDQFALALARQSPQVEIFDRSKISPEVRTMLWADPTFGATPWRDTAKEFCKATSGAIVVVGTYGPAEKGLGLSTQFECTKKAHEGGPGALSPRVKLPLTSVVSSRLGVSLDVLRPAEGVYVGGQGGLTFPRCLRCPPPQFTKEAIAREEGGIVYLTIVITPEGEPSQIKVIRGIASDLDEAAVEAVRGWTFIPSVDIDNRPVPVREPVEVSFRLYH